MFFAIYTRLQGYKIVVYNFQDHFKWGFSIFNHWQWLGAVTYIIDHLLQLRSFLADEQIHIFRYRIRSPLLLPKIVKCTWINSVDESYIDCREKKKWWMIYFCKYYNLLLLIILYLKRNRKVKMPKHGLYRNNVCELHSLILSCLLRFLS